MKMTYRSDVHTTQYKARNNARNNALGQWILLLFLMSTNVIGDFDLIIRLAAKWQFDCIQDPLAYCRWHGGNLQSVQADRHVYELSKWIIKMKTNQCVVQQDGFIKFSDDVLRMDAILKVFEDDYKKAFNSLLNVQRIANKVKILAALLLPKKVYFFLKNKFR